MGADGHGRERATRYSTGGGGVVLEHRYGATLIAALLTGAQLSELGDNATAEEVRFQASAYSPVDDLMVIGRTPDAGKRRVSIGVRRAPRLIASDKDSVSLLAAYLNIVTGHWDDVRAGRWRLVLATGSREPAAMELGDLSVIARAQGGEPAFRAELARTGPVNKKVRSRLIEVDKLVREAAAEPGANSGGIEAGELTWRLLANLAVRNLRLEGADTTDRTHAVSHLTRVTRDQTPEAADDLFNRLAELAHGYAPAGAIVTRERLSQDLSGVPMAGASPSARQVQRLAAVLVTSAATPPAGAPLGVRWLAGEEVSIGDRCYLLQDDKAGLLRERRDPGGQVSRQAVARQTEPRPAPGQLYAWLRQGGTDLTRERDLLARAQQGQRGRPSAGIPRITCYHAGPDAVTLSLSWPTDSDSLPSETLLVRFRPGLLDAWQVSLLRAGMLGLVTTLERLHRLGASHRNLALESIIVDALGRFALRDLGLAVVSFRPGEGPASYQAPEQAFGSRLRRPSPATDVYQLAAITYHLVTGRVPSSNSPPARHPGLPGAVTDILSAALVSSPDDRPSTRDLRLALNARKPAR
jgi:hypothetical protein